MANEEIQNAQEPVPGTCLHCGLPVPSDAPSLGFCCSGCEYVYHIINGHGLEEFYELKKRTPPNNPLPAAPLKSEFSDFGDPQFHELYVKRKGEADEAVLLYLDGMHCAACVWLIEKLPHIVNGIHEVRVDFGRTMVSLRYDPGQTKLPEIASVLDSLGYRPHPLRSTDVRSARKKENREMLIRIGVAGVCAGNTMMIAVSLYQGLFTGIAQKYADFFSWISLFIALPAVCYSATPFYRAAWGGLKARTLHIDLPISIGIIAGFSASLVSVLRHEAHLYFDSICMLIFLLLVGRWLQRQGVSRVLDSTELLHSVIPTRARKKNEKEVVEVFTGALVADDVVIVGSDELLPADGVVWEGEGYVDTSLLTGESRPERVIRGAEVYAGSRNLGDEFSLSVSSSGENTRVGKLMRMVEEAAQKKPPLVEVTDRISAYFVAVVLSLAIGAGLYWYHRSGIFEAIDVVLALLVITCPCALGLSAPISLSAAARKAAKEKIIIHGSDVIERLVHVQTVIFDKTGTLTEGLVQVGPVFIAEKEKCSSGAKWIEFDEALKGGGEELRRIGNLVVDLEKGSSHPIAKALREFAATNFPNQTFEGELTGLRTIPGKGVEGRSSTGMLYRLGSCKWIEESTLNSSETFLDTCSLVIAQGFSPVVLATEEAPLVVFGVGDSLKEDAKATIDGLRDYGIEAYILSGDEPRIVSQVAAQLGVPQDKVFGGASPEEKVAIVKEHQQRNATMMVGDGLNDTAALQAASVGVAVAGGAEVCFHAADIYLGRPETLTLLRAYQGAKRTIRVVYANLTFSLLYNVIGATAALCGLVSPLLAAVLMPLSSLTVIFSSLFSKTFSGSARYRFQESSSRK